MVDNLFDIECVNKYNKADMKEQTPHDFVTLAAGHASAALYFQNSLEEYVALLRLEENEIEAIRRRRNFAVSRKLDEVNAKEKFLKLNYGVLKRHEIANKTERTLPVVSMVNLVAAHTILHHPDPLALADSLTTNDEMLVIPTPSYLPNEQIVSADDDPHTVIMQLGPEGSTDIIALDNSFGPGMKAPPKTTGKSLTITDYYIFGRNRRYSVTIGDKDKYVLYIDPGYEGEQNEIKERIESVTPDILMKFFGKEQYEYVCSLIAKRASGLLST